MRIPSNKISDVIGFFRKELSEIYPEDEVNQLISMSFNHVLGFSKAELILRCNENILQSDLLKLNFICKDLKKHKPIQYILGEAEFYGLKFKVNENVLIPRPETEELVQMVARFSVGIKKSDLKILDIGTGSGCIAITLKNKLSEASVYAIDISEEALLLAKQNAEANGVDVNFSKVNALSLFDYPDLQIPDVIVSNPPYISYKEKQNIKKNVLDFEPHLALFSDENDPVIFYSRIIEYASIKSVPFLFFELNPKFANDVVLIAKKFCFNTEILKDINGHHRFLKAERVKT